MRVVETDNYGGDYPDEKFINVPPLPAYHAKKIARAINESFTGIHPRFWKVVPDDYELVGGFEP